MEYPIESPEQLRSFLQQYLPTVIKAGRQLILDLREYMPDHLGLQVMNGAEFDEVDKSILRYATLIRDDIIHNRRNRVYRFNKPVGAKNMYFPGIEIFEPKPAVVPATLRPGIEHAAYVVKDLNKIETRLKEGGPIAKDATYSLGRFIKTKLIDGVEIEFREKSLLIQ